MTITATYAAAPHRSQDAPSHLAGRIDRFGFVSRVVRPDRAIDWCLLGELFP
jgi:hypothetical protein